MMNEAKQVEKINVELTVRGLAVLNAKIEKLNRRAKRLNVTPIKVEQVTPWTPKKNNPDKEDSPSQDWAKFSVTTEVPHLSGWFFVCRIEHTSAGNILAVRPGADTHGDLVNLFSNCKPECHHCNKPRNRKDTFVIKHDDGRIKQIGRNCLADVLGLGMTPEAAAQLAEWLSDLHLAAGGDPDGGGDFEGMGCRITHMPTATFLSFVVACANAHGFKTRKQADLDETGRTQATSSDAMFNMFPPQGLNSREREELVKPTDEDRDEALKAIDWAQQLEGRSEFDHNMKVIASNEMIEFRNAGIAAFIVQARRRALEKEEERKAREAGKPESHHVGVLGKRLKKVEVVFIGTPWSGETDFGTLFIHKFMTADGSDLVWKTSSDVCADAGDKFIAAFTPKKHDDFNGRPQTQVSRMKLEEINA
jgi:hypothetical protein